MRGDRHGPRRERLPHEAGRGARPAGGRRRRRRRRRSAPPASPAAAPRTWTRSRSRRASRTSVGVRGPHRRLPARARGAGAAARAGRAAAPRAPPRGRTRSARALVVPRFAVARPEALDPGIRTGLDQLVGAGEEPLDQLRRGAGARPCGRRAARRRSPPAAARPGSRGPARVGSWKVPTFSERECRRATDAALGANGSWTWTMSKSDAPEQLLERAAEVDRDRSRPRSGTARHRDAGADREDWRASVPTGAITLPGAVEQRRRAAGARLSIARRDSRTAAREPDGAATTT